MFCQHIITVKKILYDGNILPGFLNSGPFLFLRYYYLWLALKLSSACGVLMFMKYLYKRGALKTTLVTSLSVFAMIATRIQNARLQAEMKLKPPRNF